MNLVLFQIETRPTADNVTLGYGNIGKVEVKARPMPRAKIAQQLKGLPSHPSLLG